MNEVEKLDFLTDVDIDADILGSLENDMEQNTCCESEELNTRILEKYGVDISGRYAGINLAHPFGKAAGQLSMAHQHVTSDRQNCLSFTVLKSAVGVTEGGDMGIDEWAQPAPKMTISKRISRDGREGWTVVWRGRGWTKSFDDYLMLYHESIRLNPGYPVIPSMMFDVTNHERAIEQGRYCIPRLQEIHKQLSLPYGFLMEIDISPTLFFLPNSNAPEKITGWVLTSVEATKEGLQDPGKCVIKLTNADRGAEFQLQMVEKALEICPEKTAGLLIGNRLFDHDGEFEGQKGIAYGGFDLSNANLETLDAVLNAGIKTPLIGTGNINTGKMMCEYAIRGCLSGEMHTFFQLFPADYRAPRDDAGRQWQVIRELVYHPDDGLVSMLLRLEKAGILQRRDNLLKFSELPTIYKLICGQT